MVVPEVSLDWLVRLVNDYAVAPRQASGRTDGDYLDLGPGAPGLTDWPDEAGLVRIADRLWQVFAADTDDDRADALNSLLSPARPTPSVDGDATTRWFTTTTAPAALLAAGCGLALLELVRTDGWGRLGVCAGADCADAHLDRPGRHRLYCSEVCLNRARVRAYRARQRSTKAGDAKPGGSATPARAAG